MKTRIAVACVSLTLTGTALAAAPSPTFAGPEGLLDLQAVTKELLAVNPAIKAARFKWEAVKQRIPQARAWEDLKAGVDVERGGDDTEWMLMQAIPVSGKNKRAERITRSEAAAALAEVEMLELELTSRARVAALQLANAQQQLSLNQSNQTLLAEVVQTTRAQFEAGKRTLSDVLASQMDLAKFRETQYDIEREISEATSEINLLLNRPAQADLPRPPRLAFTPSNFDLTAMQKLALAHRPELRAASYRIDAADGTIDLAKRAWIPDPEIRTEIRNMIGGPGAGMVEYDTGIFITVPWFNRKKYQAKIDEARHGAEGARSELEALQTETLRHIRDQLKKVTTFHHHTTLFQNKLLPLARETLKTARTDYEAGRTTVTAVLMAVRDLQDVESTYWHHLSMHQIALAELTPMLGGDPRMLEKQASEKGMNP